MVLLACKESHSLNIESLVEVIAFFIRLLTIKSVVEAFAAELSVQVVEVHFTLEKAITFWSLVIVSEVVSIKDSSNLREVRSTLGISLLAFLGLSLLLVNGLLEAIET